MSSEEYISGLQRKLEELKEHNKPYEIAIKTVMSQIPTRIFAKGIKSDGTQIGTYDAKVPDMSSSLPRISGSIVTSVGGVYRGIYVSDDDLRKKGNHKGKTGKTIKTSYYKNYKELKQQQGFEAEFVNLRLTNQLQSDLSNVAIGKTTQVAAAINPDKISPHEYHVTLKNQRNIDIAKYSEDKYGTVFQPTKEEVDLLYKTAEFELEIFMSE